VALSWRRIQWPWTSK